MSEAGASQKRREKPGSRGANHCPLPTTPPCARHPPPPLLRHPQSLLCLDERHSETGPSTALLAATPLFECTLVHPEP